MNVFKVHKGYRKFGLNYGLPVFHVDMGFGVNYDPTEVIKKLMDMDLKEGSWVVVRNNPLKEKGIGVLVQGLKYIRMKVEIEDDGTSLAPGWFPQVDRWIIEYKGDLFNYMALRPRQDMLTYRGNDIDKFLEETKDVQALRVLVVKDEDEVWDKVKDYNVRVYRNAK